MPLDHGQQALLIVDMQTSFLAANGVIARTRGALSGSEDLVKRTACLVDQARTRGMPIVYTRHGYRADYADADLLMRRDEAARREKALVAGTADAEIMAELAPLADDVVIDKNRYDAFRCTSLDAELRRRDVTELLIAGILTNVCVETTARAAYDRDYAVVVVAGCTAARTETLRRNAIDSLVASRLARAVSELDVPT